MSDNVGFPLSPQQADKVHVYDAAARVAVKARLKADVDSTKVVNGLNQLVALHESLRTNVVFVEKAGMHLQSLQPSGAVAYHQVEANALAGDDWQQLVAQPNKEGELVSLYLAKASDDEYLIAISCLPLLMDASSLMVLLAQLCDALEGELPDEEEDVIQYADYAQWQADLIQGDDEDADLNALNFWQKQHQYAVSLDALPLAKTDASGNKARAYHILDAQELGQVTAKAQSLGVELEHCLALAWSQVLARHSQMAELMLTLELDGRDEDLDASVGLFSKNVPMLFNLQDDDIAGAIAKIAADFEKARAFVDSYDWSDNHQPLGFGYVNLQQAQQNDSLVNEDCLLPQGRESLRLLVVHQPQQLTLMLDYDDGQYAQLDAELLLAQMSQLMLRMAQADGQNKVSDLSMYSDADHLLLGEFVQPLPQPEFESVISRFVKQATANPNAIAVQCGEKGLSYGDLYAQASGVANGLAAKQITIGDKVGVHMANPVNAIVGLVAIGLVGAVYVPLDITYPHERLGAMVEDAQVKLVLVEPGSDEQDFGVETIDVTQCQPSAPLTPAAVNGLSPVYVIFTSGSTGRPKGVLVSHGNLDSSNQARINFYQVDSATRFLLLSSFSFDSSIAGLYSTISGGGTLCLIDGNNVSEFGVVAEAIADMQVTHTLMVPSLYGALLPNVESASLASLQSVIVAGERCPQSLIDSHQQTLPACQLINEYGPTEGTVWATADKLHCNEHTRERVTLGAAIENTHLYVLDANWQTQPIGVVGELYIAGHGVTQGYCQRAGQTAERYMPDICGDGTRMYRTGDLARVLSDGRIDFVGRADHQVKLRGFRIEIGEIEDVMLKHASIDAVAVELHSAEELLVCFYTAANEIDETQLEQHALEKLPGYMKPGAFIHLAELPLTANGKVDRQALKAWDMSKTEVAYEAPETDTEQALVTIWSDLIADHQIGRAHDFFHIGGHSLLAMQLSSRIREQFEVDVSVQLIFDHAVLSDQAAQIDSLKAEQDEDMDVYEF